MFHYFKTSINFNHPLESLLINNLNDYFKHPINNTGYDNKICQFGKDIIWILLIYIFYKNYISKVSKNISLFVIFIVFILSLMNFNSFVYLIPFFICEIKIIYLTKH